MFQMGWNHQLVNEDEEFKSMNDMIRGSLNGKLQFEKWQNITQTDFCSPTIFMVIFLQGGVIVTTPMK